MKPLSVCIVLIYLAKVVGSTVRKDSADIEDESHSPLVIDTRDRNHEKPKTPSHIPKHHSEARYDHSPEIKYRREVLPNITYTTMSRPWDRKEGFVLKTEPDQNYVRWRIRPYKRALYRREGSMLTWRPYKHDNYTDKMADGQTWSTSWGTNSASNGANTSNSQGGNGGQWSTTGGQNSGGNHGGSSGNTASNGGGNGGQWSTTGGQNSGGNHGGSSGNTSSNGGSNGGQWSWSNSGGQSTGGQISAGGHVDGVTNGGSVSAGTKLGGGGYSWGGSGGSKFGGKLGVGVGGNIAGGVSVGHAAAGGLNIGIGGSLAGGSAGGISLNLGRTGNGGYLSANGKFVFSQRLKEYQRDVLKMHNKYRKIHNAQALRLDIKLSKGAMTYARILTKSVKRIRHSKSFKDIKIGENLLTSAVPITGATVVKTWYDQVYDYDFTKHKGRNGAPYSAFVQVVWRKTRRIGVGRAVGKVKGQLWVFYVVRYRPTGYVGTVRNFRRNVQRGKFRGGQFGIAGGSAGGMGVMEDLQTFVSSALNTHNMLRSMHGVPALRLDQNLCQQALRKSTPDERGGIVTSEAGMNVFDICQGTMSGAAVTKEWYKDACFYDFEKQDSSRETKSQFRQMIWKNSKNFGISYKVYRNENKMCVRIVALYIPAMEEANINLHDQVKKGTFLGCQNGMFSYKGGITVSQCGS